MIIDKEGFLNSLADEKTPDAMTPEDATPIPDIIEEDISASDAADIPLQDEPAPVIDAASADITTFSSLNKIEQDDSKAFDPTEPKEEQQFDFNKLIRSDQRSIVPRETLMPEPAIGSVWEASLKRETSLGLAFSEKRLRDLEDAGIEGYSPIADIPEYMLPHAEYYMMDRSKEQVDQTTRILEAEMLNERILAENPWQALLASFAVQPLDPINYLPGFAIYKGVKRGSSILKVASKAASAGLVSTSAQEALLLSDQLTRTTEEAAWNTLSSAILGGALGYGVTKIERGNRLSAIKSQRAQKDILNVLTEKSVELNKNGLITDNDLANMPELIKKTMVVSPLARLSSSSFDSAKRFSQLFIESNWFTKGHEEGRTAGHSVETNIKARERIHQLGIINYQNTYFDMVGVSGKAFRGTRAKLSNPEMSFNDYAKRVSRVIVTQEQDVNSFVNKGARHIEEETALGELRSDMVELGLISGEKGTKTSEGYLTIILDKDKVIQQGGREARGEGTYPQAVYDGMKRTQDKVIAFKETDTYKNLFDELSALKKQVKSKSITIDEKKSLKESIGNIKEQIELKAGDPYMFNKKGELWKVIDDDALWEQAMSVVDTQLGNKGEMLYSTGIKGSGLNPKQLKSRTLMIDQETLSEWHLQDPARIAELFSRSLTPKVEMEKLAHRLGYKDFDSAKVALIDDLKSEYDLQSKGKTGKQALKLKKQFEIVKNDMLSEIEILNGVYGEGPNKIIDNQYAKFFRNFRVFNSMRMLGAMTLTSLADVGIQVLTHGPFNYIYHGLLPVLKEFAHINKKDMRAIGYGIESELGMRVRALQEHDNLISNPGFITRTLDTLSQGFGDLTLMNQFNSMNQRIAGRLSVHRTLDTIHNIIEGKKVSNKDIRRVAQLGLEEKYYKYIFDKTKDNIDSSGTRFADWTTWDVQNKFEADALRAFQFAVGKEINSIVIMPGAGDLPLSARTGLGKTLLQFKSFMFASTNKILYSAVQRRGDAEVYSGLTTMLAMGAVSYVLTKYSRGEEPDLSFENLAGEAIDRSGALGVVMEVYNLANKVGVVPGQGLTRYDSRGIQGALFGPTINTIFDTANLFNKMSNIPKGGPPMNTSDVQKFLRLAPYQNLFYLQYLNGVLVGKIGENYNLPETRKGY